MVSYLLVFSIVVGLISTGHETDSIVVAERKEANQITSLGTSEKPSIDQVAASQLAATLAERADLPVAINASNEAISVNAKSELAQTDDNLISKPQIVQPTTSAARGITSYTAQPGDTVATVAAKFKLEKDTIKWANDLQSDALEPSRVLIIPPVDGVVYTAGPGETIASLAQKFSADQDRIILFNDLELNATINPGTKIVIPGGSVAAPAPVATPAQGSGYYTGTVNRSVNFAILAASGNRYDYGYCTWYAYNRRAALGMPIGGMWGNASSWAALARAAGFLVNSTPSIGAVMANGGGYGHVAVVESINDDGSITVSEMNYAGWNVKSSRTIAASQVGSYSFIH